MRPPRACLGEARATLERLAGDARVPAEIRACLPRMLDAVGRGLAISDQTGQG